VVRYCGFIDAIASAFNSDIEFPALSREVFEDMLQDYLCQFAEMVNDCLDDAGFDKSSLDYVILTGGHSQWYFTDEILTGGITKFGRIGLDKITSDNRRVIKLSKPQETVALGLVYQPININAGRGQATQETEETQSFCGYCGQRKYAAHPVCPYCSNHVPDDRIEWIPEPETHVYQGNNVNTAVSSNANTYTLPPNKNVEGLVHTLISFLDGTKKMDAQVISSGDGGKVIQARDKKGGWKQFIGMDKALTVRINQIEPGRVSVSIGEAKWGDKIGVMALSMIILWPLTVTSGIGMYMQSKLPGEILNVISMYVTS
jgi:cell division ATPase FtsA